jgi:hypothetical protein
VDEADRARSGRHGAAERHQDVLGRVVADGMHGVQAKAVQVVLLEPIEGVVHHELADDSGAGAVEVHGLAPGVRWRGANGA